MVMIMARSRSLFSRVFAGEPPTPAKVSTVGEISYSDGAAYGPAVAWNPNPFMLQKGFHTIDQMLTDDQLKAALLFKKHTVLATDYSIKSTEGHSLEECQFTRFVNDQLTDPAIDLDQVMLEMLSALEYGFSVTEKVYERITEGEWKGKIGLKALKTRKPHDFTFRTDRFGNLLPDGVRQVQDGVPVDLPSWKFVIFTYQKQFGNLYGISDLEAAFRGWWARANSYRYLMRGLERFGVPPVIAMYNEDAYDLPQQNRLKSVIKNLQLATSALLPRKEKDNLEFWTPELGERIVRAFDPAMKMFTGDMARAVLMPGLLGLTPDQAQGSFARAAKIFDVFILVSTYIRKMVERKIREEVMNELLLINFPEFASKPELKCPWFEFEPITDDLRIDILESWTKMVETNVVNRQESDEDHIRSLTKFPAMNVEDRVTGPETSEPNDPEDPIEPDKPKPKGDDDEEEIDDEDEDEEDLAVKAAARLFEDPDRPMTEAEKRVDFTALVGGLDAIEMSATASMIEVLSTVRDRVVKDFNKVGDPEKFLSEFQGIPLKASLQKTVRSFLDETFAFGRKTLREGVAEALKNLSVEFVDGGPNFEPKEAARFLRAKSFYVTGVIDQRLTAEVHAIMLNAIRVGEIPRVTSEKITQAFGPYTGDPRIIADPDVAGPFRVETIVRTNATEALNQGRLVEARRPGIAEVMNGMQYSAIIDSRTTPVCRNLDRKIFKMSDGSLDTLAPPNHFNCRSVLVPVTADIEVAEDEFVTPSQSGAAIEEAGKGFV